MPVPGRQLGASIEMHADQWPQLVTYPSVAGISSALGNDLYHWVLFLDKSSSVGFEGRDWKPVYMSPAKHRAYAFQWFALSFATLVGWIFLSYKRQKK